MDYPIDLRIEHLADAVGIGAERPRLSWRVLAPPDWRQTGYEVEAVGPAGDCVAASGRIASAESALAPWPFAPLASRARLRVRVRAWDASDRPTGWSDFVPIEAGLLQPEDWTARFIAPDWDEDLSRPQPCPLLRREFALRHGAAVASARLYITSLGVYEAQLNGALVGDHVMAPGWTSYDHRLRYQTFDVTGLLRPGPNALGVILADGWFRGRLGVRGGRRNLYGDRLALIAQLEITYADGTTERLVTDAAWRATTGPLRASDIYDGETYDARLEQPGWSAAGFDDAAWSGVRLLERNCATLVAASGPPVRRIDAREPIAITVSPSGRTLLDFGQNLVGRLRLTARGAAGDAITLRHAEVLEHGELCVRPLRYAAATDRYTLAGGAVETWEPRFTFHGFRYAEVDGWPGELTPGAITALVCHSDMARTGWFECSDPLLNRFHENVVWSMRGNFFDIPTDCPQRDERLGWTGDLQVFAPAACFLYDVAGFLRSWLADLAVEARTAGGVVPVVVPYMLPRPVWPAAAWGDAVAIVPWVLYERYGDAQFLADHFSDMAAWVDAVAAAAGPTRIWDSGEQFGDWLDPKAPPDRPGEATTEKALVATAYFARSAQLTAEVARVLGRTAAELRYAALAAEVRAAFVARFVDPDGRLTNDTATAHALALEFSLLPAAAQREAAGRRLAELVASEGYRIPTGFVGTPLICDALTHAGETEAAYRLLLQTACPSWLYPVTMGATTIWERWDSLLPDGSVNPGQMTSFNHYALGAVADWLHRTVAGLAPAAPGYRRIAIRPLPGGGLTWARARHLTPYGPAECAWRVDGDGITVEAEIPPGVTAEVALPWQPAATFHVGPGRHRWTGSRGAADEQ
jgi:alpha-L-rhamnosidase